MPFLIRWQRDGRTQEHRVPDMGTAADMEQWIAGTTYRTEAPPDWPIWIALSRGVDPGVEVVADLGRAGPAREFRSEAERFTPPPKRKKANAG